MNERLAIRKGLRRIVQALALRGPLETNSTARTLHALVLTLAIWFGLWSLILVPLYPNASAKLPCVILQEAGPLAALILLRFGYLRQASLAYLAGTWAFTTLVVVLDGGILRSPAQAFYATLPILATWLLGRRGALWTAAGCLFTALFFAILELAGVRITPRIQPTPLGVWAVLLQVICIGAVPVAHVLRRLDQYKEHLERLVVARTAQLHDSNRELLAEREFLDMLIRHAPYPIAVVKGRELRYRMANSAYEALVGPGSRVVGRTHREIFPEIAAPGEERSLLKTIETGEPWIIQDFSTPVTGGPEKIWEGRASRLPMIPGEEPSALIIAWDVTERKQSEERLRYTQKMESVGLLAGGVAHDFNNLLTVIMGSASAALMERPSCNYSKAIVAAAERAAQLTKQLLAYAGKGHVAKKIVDLADLIMRSRELFVASVPKRVNLVFNLAEGIPAVEQDPSQIEQILMNLVINAAEAIPPNVDGRIEVGTGISELTQEAASRQARYEIPAAVYVWLEVKDNGAGMDEATKSRIFDPFFTTKFTGRGLGLAAVDGIVRSSGGFIDVSSTPGGGATFRVFLPASDKNPVAQFETPARRTQHRSVSTVLVVDDEEMVRKLVSVVLQRRGYEVIEAKDGKDALQVLANCRTLPSVVLLDLAMPVMGGDELIPILAKQYPSLKIVISSAFPEDVAGTEFAGTTTVAGFVQKPYTASALVDKVDEILAGGREQSGKVIHFPKLG